MLTLVLLWVETDNLRSKALGGVGNHPYQSGKEAWILIFIGVPVIAKTSPSKTSE